MTVCKLAGLPVAFLNRYPYFPRLMQDYLTEDAPLITLSLSEEEIAAEGARGGRLPPDLSQEAQLAYLEALAFYRKLSLALPRYGGFFLHAALIAAEGEGIAITARSGVGKSTHASLWCDLLSDGCRILNGDKPLIRRCEGGFLGFGTPFAGKEGRHENASVPVRTLLLLERGSEDRLTPVSSAEAFPALYAATLAPEDTEAAARLLPLLSEFLGSVRVFRASVTPRLSAAETAYRTIFQKELPR